MEDDDDDLAHQFNESATLLKVPGGTVPGAASQPGAWQEASGSVPAAESPAPAMVEVVAMVEERRHVHFSEPADSEDTADRRLSTPGSLGHVMPGAASHSGAWQEASSGSIGPRASPEPEIEMVEMVEDTRTFASPTAPVPIGSGDSVHRMPTGRIGPAGPSPRFKGSLVPLTESGSVTVPRDALLASHLGSGPPTLKRAHTLSGDLDSRFGQGSHVIVTTEASDGNHFHWFRWPSLRQEWLDEERKVMRRDRKDRKANLMELYYDLIFVAVIGLLGHSIRLQSTLTANFFIDFIALFHIWIETLMFLDRFDSGDGLSRVLILCTMAGVVGMGMTGLEAQNVGPRNEVSSGYVVSFIFARTAIELLYATTISIARVRM
jgi:hypothetical protein